MQHHLTRKSRRYAGFFCEFFYCHSFFIKYTVLDEEGKQKYDDSFSTDWGDPATLEVWRENWEKIVNEKFAEKGLTCRVDHRSNEERGLDEIPQVHEGSAVHRMEKSFRREWQKEDDGLYRNLSRRVEQPIDGDGAVGFG